MKIGFVCTNYNNSSFAHRAVESLHAGDLRRDVHTVIVDNHSRPEDVEQLTATVSAFPNVELIRNDINVGYFAGLNVGLQRLRNRHPDIQHIVIGNNDLVFPPGFVESFERQRDVFDQWAIVAPDIVTFTGVHQNPHVLRPISPRRKRIYDVYHSSYVAAVLIKLIASSTYRFTSRRRHDKDAHRVPAPIILGFGACYLLGPRYFSRFSGLPAPTFFMQEEFFLSEQLATAGERLYYDPGFVVMHHDHATMDRLPSRFVWEVSRAAYRIYKQYLRMSASDRLTFLAESAGATRPTADRTH